MNDFNVHKIPKFRILIQKLFETYPVIDENFSSQLHEYKDFNLPIQQPQPNTEKDVKKLVHDNDELSISITTYQMFVRNFMSNYTPYNGMLLFHGLGTGKTCSAITICEEYRNYLKSAGKHKRIYVLSMTDAILKNFKYQLFNESHLLKVNNKWVCNSCVGDKFLQELDPYQILPMEKDSLCKLIQSLIDDYYTFIGCAAFANDYSRNTDKKTEKGKMNYIKEHYEGALFVMDEAHNIKGELNDHPTTATQKPDKEEIMKFSNALTQIVTYTTVKLLMMTATPVFHSCRDFIFLSQILNLNDKVPIIQDSSKIFDVNDNFVEGGKEVLFQHLHGYISFVKGENPYSFPYRIYPETSYSHPENREYTIEHLQIYPVTLSEFQSNKYLEQHANAPNSGMELSVITIYNQLAFITYPKGEKIGEAMIVNTSGKLPDLSYSGTERFFDPENIQTYSAKLHQIQTSVSNAEGIILIYVQQITEGIFPIAVALEAIGYKYKDKHRRVNLCKDYTTVKDTNYSYVILNPSVGTSPIQDIISSVNEHDNKDGKDIKVVIITGAYTEGVDFKNIRQIHIINPWWNLSQIEQIIGRAVRFRSHKDLDFEKRNVELFLYTAFLKDNSMPTIDYRMYSNCEQKAKKIGEVTRFLKEIAFDCRFNSVQTQSNESLNGLSVKQITSSGIKKQTPIGDVPYTVLTDYMKDCNYTCATESAEPGTKLSMDYITSHTNAIIQQITRLFSKNYVYTYEELLEELQITVPEEKLNYALSQMINNKVPVFDRFNREGYIVNIGEYYMFQPPQLTTMIPTYERRIPMAYVYDSIIVEPIERQKVEIDVQKLITTLKTKFDIAEKETPMKGRALSEEYLVYRAFIELYKKLVTIMSITPVEWKEQRRTIYVNALMDRLNDVQCLELAKYLHKQPKLNEFEHRLKAYYTQLQVNDIYILWAYNVNKIDYYTNDWKDYVHYEYPTLPLFKKDADKNLFNKDLPLGGISASKDLSEREFKLSLPTTPNEKPRYGFKITKKPDAIEILQQLIPTPSATETKLKMEDYILQIEFCLRYFDMQKWNNKRWFLNPVEVIQNVARNFNLINENIKEKEKKNKKN